MKSSQQVLLTKKIKALCEELNGHDYRYHVLDRPIISDKAYDDLLSELRSLEEKHPELLTPDSPTQRVGGTPLGKFEKLRHRTPMLSLQNSYNTEELVEFHQRILKLLDNRDVKFHYLCEPKFDGLAIELIYENGLLTGALTRGDGLVGENVLANVKTIKSIPLRLHSKNPPKLLEVRGEILIYKEDFKNFNEALQEDGQLTFANPRNAAAGTIRQLDSRVAAQRPLKMFAYALGASEGTNYKTQLEIETAFKDLGLPGLDSREGGKASPRLCQNIEEVIDYYNFVESLRHDLPFDIDGIVVKINELDLQDSLGFVARSPRWAVAAKFQPEQAITRVNEIIVQVGRTGALTPVAIMAPVKVGGVTIIHATLHNQDEIDRKDVRVGDSVVIQRAGDVIPEIVSVLLDKRPKKSVKYEIPKKCPACNSLTNKEEGEVISRCINSLCPARLKESLKHFVSRRAMNVDKLGEKQIEQLVDVGLVHSFSDIYKLKREALMALERKGEKSVENLLASIEKSRQSTLARFVFALGIRFVGEQTAKDLAHHFKTFELFEKTTEEELLEISGIGPRVATSILNALKTKVFIDDTHRTIKHLVFEKARVLASKALSNKSFLVTGTLPVKRDQAKDLVESHGGKILSTVGKNSNYLIVGSDPGSKLDRANELNIPVLDWPGLLKLIKDGQ